MELIEVATELTEVRDNKNKNLYNGSRNRGEGLDLRILETGGGWGSIQRGQELTDFGEQLF